MPSSSNSVEKFELSDTELEARMSVYDWTLSNLESTHRHGKDDWDVWVAVTLWWLWRWRNERCFRKPSLPLNQMAFIYARVCEINRALWLYLTEGLDRKRKRVEQFIRWSYPREGWVCLNTDGAAKGNPGRAGACGLIRGHKGELFEMFASIRGSCSCTKAKLWVVLRGLAIAWNGGHRMVQLTVDSEIVFRLLVEECPPSSPYIHLIRKCKSMICRSK